MSLAADWILNRVFRPASYSDFSVIQRNSMTQFQPITQWLPRTKKWGTLLGYFFIYFTLNNLLMIILLILSLVIWNYISTRNPFFVLKLMTIRGKINQWKSENWLRHFQWIKRPVPWNCHGPCTLFDRLSFFGPDYEFLFNCLRTLKF